MRYQDERVMSGLSLRTNKSQLVPNRSPSMFKPQVIRPGLSPIPPTVFADLVPFAVGTDIPRAISDAASLPYRSIHLRRSRLQSRRGHRSRWRFHGLLYRLRFSLAISGLSRRCFTIIFLLPCCLRRESRFARPEFGSKPVDRPP